LIERAAGLIERESEAWLMRGEVTTLAGWIQKLPQELLYSRPRLDLFYVSCLIMLGESLEACEAGLRRLSEAPDLVFQVWVLRALLALFQGEYETVDTLACRALEELPEQESFFRSLASWSLTISQMAESDLDRRIILLENLLARSRALGNRLLWVNALCSLAEVRFRQGKLPLARDLYLEAIRDGVGPDGRKLPVVGEAMIGLGYILREWNELDAAAQYLLEGIDLIRQARLFGTIEGWVALALVRQAQGEGEAAQQIIQEIRHTARAFRLSNLGEQLAEFYAAMILHRLGDSQAYPRYFQSKSASGQNSLAGDAQGSAQLEHSLYKYEQVALAHAFLTQEQPADALSALEPLLPTILEQGRATLAVEIEILRALALQALNQPVEAQAAFEHALAIAEPGQMVRIFIDEGQPVISFLHKAIRREIYPEYAARLLAAFDADGSGMFVSKSKVEGYLVPPDQQFLQNVQPSTFELSNTIDPLSQRELEVLRLLAGSLPARDIAGQLFVAESTLNSHIKSIYAKLGVHRRIEAVQRAKELGLV
jgi:LuxR family maltose regulon positive regulatory protein